jgi:hypothetical protein
MGWNDNSWDSKNKWSGGGGWGDKKDNNWGDKKNSDWNDKKSSDWKNNGDENNDKSKNNDNKSSDWKNNWSGGNWEDNGNIGGEKKQGENADEVINLNTDSEDNYDWLNDLLGSSGNNGPSSSSSSSNANNNATSSSSSNRNAVSPAHSQRRSQSSIIPLSPTSQPRGAAGTGFNKNRPWNDDPNCWGGGDAGNSPSKHKPLGMGMGKGKNKGGKGKGGKGDGGSMAKGGGHQPSDLSFVDYGKLEALAKEKDALKQEKLPSLKAYHVTNKDESLADAQIRLREKATGGGEYSQIVRVRVIVNYKATEGVEYHQIVRVRVLIDNIDVKLL